MNRDQFAELERMILENRGNPDTLSRIYIDDQENPKLLDEDDPPFFARILSRPIDRGLSEPPSPAAGHERHHIPDQVKREVLGRDGCRCYLCDSAVLMDGLHYDHIIPVSQGGTNDAANIAVTCAACNMAKAGKFTTKRPRRLRLDDSRPLG